MSKYSVLLSEKLLNLVEYPNRLLDIELMSFLVESIKIANFSLYIKIKHIQNLKDDIQNILICKSWK